MVVNFDFFEKSGFSSPFRAPKKGVVTGIFWFPSWGVVKTDFFLRADFSVGYLFIEPYSSEFGAFFGFRHGG